MTRKTIRNQLTVVAAVRGSKFEWANATRTKLDVPEIAKEAAIMVEAAVFQQLLADESVAAQVMEIFEPED
jgi:DNA gyrase/topoisomerase IV subunit B